MLSRTERGCAMDMHSRIIHGSFFLFRALLANALFSFPPPPPVPRQYVLFSSRLPSQNCIAFYLFTHLSIYFFTFYHCFVSLFFYGFYICSYEILCGLKTLAFLFSRLEESQDAQIINLKVDLFALTFCCRTSACSFHSISSFVAK